MTRILLALMTGCMILGVFAQSSRGGEPVKIGALYNLTGDMAPIDGPAMKGARLKAKLINQAGGLLNHRLVEVVGIDTRSDLKAAAAGARELLSQKVVAGIGYGDTDYVLAAAPLFQARGLPFITSGATLPDLPRRVGNCLFMAAFGDDDQAAAMAQFIYTRLKGRSVIIWTDKSMDFARTLAKYFRQAFDRLGGRIIHEDFFSSQDQDFPGMISRLKTAEPRPDVIFIAAGPDAAAQAVKQLREASVTIPIAGGDSFDSEGLIKVPGPRLAQDLYFSTHSFRGETGPEVRSFMEAYQKEYGHPPEDAFAALGFDALGLAAAAIKRAGSTKPEALCRALSQMQDYQGVTGKISYRPLRAPAKPVSIIGVRQGRFQPLWSWPPQEKKNEK